MSSLSKSLTPSRFTSTVYRRPLRWYVSKIIAYGVLVVGTVVMIIPFMYMVSTSLKTTIDSYSFPPTWIPNPVVWQNYVDIWKMAPLFNVAINSIKISVLSTLGQVISCSLAAFAFARLRFKGREVIFMLVLATMMIPSQVTLIPTYLVFRAFGWINTHAPLIVPSWFGGAFGIFLVRQFFLSIPEELVDAAKVDGCNPFRIYWQIFMPLAMPVLATMAIFSFLNSWNDLLGPLIYLRDLVLMTFPVALASFSGHNVMLNLPLLMTASLVSILPTVILVFAMQKYFIQGIVLSGLKV
jgi:ABC-type glycerol-3-phosphate transport system permease component